MATKKSRGSLCLTLGLIANMGCSHAPAPAISKQQATELAEAFVAENGYTNLPANKAKAVLDRAAMELSHSREDLLKQRFNMLKPKAIGIRLDSGNDKSRGWSVAFDFVSPPPQYKDYCRIVTMNEDGEGTHLVHEGVICSYFKGFDQ